MRKPVNANEFMNKLREALDDSIISEVRRYYNLTKACECISVREYGNEKIIELRFYTDDDRIYFYNGNKLENWLEFKEYKSQTTYFMAIARNLVYLA